MQQQQHQNQQYPPPPQQQQYPQGQGLGPSYVPPTPMQMQAATQFPPPAPISTEQIQNYLDENKQLILAILDNQNLGKLAECAQYQAQLQKNLLYLAAIADAQPQASVPRPQQMHPNAQMQQAVPFMQQPGVFPPRASMQASMQFNPQQPQELPPQHQLHHPQMIPIQGHMGLRPAMNNGMHVMPVQGAIGGSNSGMPSATNQPEFTQGGASSSLIDGRGSKQDTTAASESASEGLRDSAADQGSGDGEAHEN